MKTKLIVLKIGGSILAPKKQEFVYQEHIAQQIIDQIKKYQKLQPCQLIIVHGTGSFGHPVAHQYQLASGKNNKQSNIGFSISKRHGFWLNQYIWKSFEEAGLPMVTIQTSAITHSENSIISDMKHEIVQEYLDHGFIVTMFGDEVLDTKMGFSICSSDQIAAYLASKLNADQLIYATDVDGVYDKNPKVDPDSKRIDIIKKSESVNILGSIEQHNHQDVSGEMAGKLEAIFNYSYQENIDIKICSGLIKGRIFEALNAESVGTKLIV